MSGDHQRCYNCRDISLKIKNMNYMVVLEKNVKVREQSQ